MPAYLDLGAVAFCGIAGAIAAGRKGLDLFGVLAFACITGVGGGTMRDLLLGAPVFWIEDPVVLGTAAAGGLATFIAAHWIEPPRRSMRIIDAFGLALFAVVGADKALGFGAHPAVAAIMGLVTGTVGGAIRDVLSGQIPAIFRREIYATAALAGAGTFVALHPHLDRPLPTLIGIGTGLAIRLLALFFSLNLPRFTLHGGDED
ncbi:MAG: trimeric intracellular cation channel family protein [Verrucomicrobiales bacterium]